MIKILQFLWSGCWHKWSPPYGSTIDHYMLDIVDGRKYYTYSTKHSKCEKCNKFKEVKVPRYDE